MNLESANNKVIENAFAGLLAKKDDAILNNLRSILPKAVNYALTSHDAEHANHVLMGDSYGWAIVHNGQVVEQDVVAAGGEQGNASEALAEVARSVGSSGWTGIVMAGMQPASYFAFDYEVGILISASSFTEQEFSKHFHKVA